MSPSRTVLPAALLALAASSLTSAATAHDFWINHGNYTSPTGEHCCGDRDCRALAPSDVRITPRGYVLTNGELVPFEEAQPSEDGAYWRCKRYDGSRRCFFAPQPSS
jgi:hypothetical protein